MHSLLFTSTVYNKDQRVLYSIWITLEHYIGHASLPQMPLTIDKNHKRFHHTIHSSTLSAGRCVSRECRRGRLQLLLSAPPQITLPGPCFPRVLPHPTPEDPLLHIFLGFLTSQSLTPFFSFFLLFFFFYITKLLLSLVSVNSIHTLSLNFSSSSTKSCISNIRRSFFFFSLLSLFFFLHSKIIILIPLTLLNSHLFSYLLLFLLYSIFSNLLLLHLPFTSPPLSGSSAPRPLLSLSFLALPKGFPFP